MSLKIRVAKPTDGPVIHEMILELAAFEKAAHEVQSSPEVLSAQLANSSPPFQCFLAVLNDTVVGFALYFYSYSTWRGKKGVWLEDLYVRDSYRGKGVGSALFDAVLQKAKHENAGRVEWPVLDWNRAAHQFYRQKGAEPLVEWRTWRLSL